MPSPMQRAVEVARLLEDREPDQPGGEVGDAERDRPEIVEDGAAPAWSSWVTIGAMASASASWTGTTTTASRRVLRSASGNLRSSAMRRKFSSAPVSPSRPERLDRDQHERRGRRRRGRSSPGRGAGRAGSAGACRRPPLKTAPACPVGRRAEERPLDRAGPSDGASGAQHGAWASSIRPFSAMACSSSTPRMSGPRG